MVLVLSCSSLAFAAEDTNVVSIQDYENTLKAAYAQYGMEFDVLDSNGNATVTRDMLNKDLAKVEKVRIASRSLTSRLKRKTLQPIP